MKYGNRPKWNRVLASPITILALLIVLIILARATWGIHQKSLKSNVRLERVAAELEKLKKHEADLDKQVEFLSSNEGIEAALRSKFRAAKEGESIAVIIDDTKDSAAASNALEDAKDKRPFWKKILQGIGF